jgi:hypothetical protein
MIHENASNSEFQPLCVGGLAPAEMCGSEDNKPRDRIPLKEQGLPT